MDYHSDDHHPSGRSDLHHYLVVLAVRIDRLGGRIDHACNVDQGASVGHADEAVVGPNCHPSDQAFAYHLLVPYSCCSMGHLDLLYHYYWDVLSPYLGAVLLSPCQKDEAYLLDLSPYHEDVACHVAAPFPYHEDGACLWGDLYQSHQDGACLVDLFPSSFHDVDGAYPC